MKKIYLLFVLSVLCMSCSDDFISKNPPSDLNSEGFYKTETDMNQAVLSAYANLRSLYNQTYVRLGEIRSDNTTYSWLSGNPANEKGIDEFSSPLLPENNFLASCWDDSYKTILRCNIVIGRIENIEFNNGDDNVAIKCGRDNDGWKTSCPSENIIIRNCKFKGLHGVVLGSEMSSGIQHVFVENCTYGGYCKRGIFIKTNPDRGGFIRDIYVNNCEFGEVEDLFYVTSMYAGEGMDNHHFTEVHDIYVKDLKCKKVNVAALVLQGTEEKPIYNVTFDNVDVDKAGIGLGFSNTKTIGVSNCNVGGYVGVPSTASAKDGIFNK